MNRTMQVLWEQLWLVSQNYNAIVTNARFDPKDWNKNVKLLSPIVAGLTHEAERQIEYCKTEIACNNDTQVRMFDRRATLYERWEKEKSLQSESDIALVGIVQNIALLCEEIARDEAEIAELQKRIAELEKERAYWDTVFWATCWIPFVSIGTGVKKDHEDNACYAAVEVLKREIQKKRDRIDQLNEERQALLQKKKESKEASGALANLITMIEGELTLVTTEINTLRQDMRQWENILSACREVHVQLQYTGQNMDAVKDCFKRLLKVQELLSPPTTDKYIKGCKCKGDKLVAGEVLRQDEYLLSPNKRFAAVMQRDNNFVVYNTQQPIWASGTYGAQGNGFVELDTTGLVVFKGTNRIWNTKRSGAVQLVMQDDGNLVTYNKDHQSLWGTDTYTYANIPSICFGA